MTMIFVRQKVSWGSGASVSGEGRSQAFFGLKLIGQMAPRPKFLGANPNFQEPNTYIWSEKKNNNV